MAKSKQVVTDTTDAPETDRPYFEEWEVKITRNKAEKLKLARPRVKITEDQAAMLNDGRLYGGNTYTQLYYSPGADQPVLPNNDNA